jgi:hypothetical protein
MAETVAFAGLVCGIGTGALGKGHRRQGNPSRNHRAAG